MEVKSQVLPLARWRPKKNQCFSSGSRAGRDQCPNRGQARRSSLLAFLFYSGLRLYVSALGRTNCFSHSNVKLIQRHLFQSNVGPKVWIPCGPVKSKCKISHHGGKQRSYELKFYCLHMPEIIFFVILYKFMTRSTLNFLGGIKTLEGDTQVFVFCF